MNRRELFKHISNGLLLLGVVLLTYKFLAWNYWKVDMAVATARGILRAPSAVNLTLSSESGTLFKTGFVHNPGGHCYIINQWDLVPYIESQTIRTNNTRRPDRLVSTIKKGLRVLVNGEEIENRHLELHAFRRYNILAAEFGGETFYFAFISENCGLKCFVNIMNRLPGIVDMIEAKKKRSK